MADSAYQPSNLGGATTGFVAPARPVTPTPPAPATSTTYAPSFDVHQALINAGATPNEAKTLTAISGAESGFRPNAVSPPNKNGSRDYGAFQINDAAHPQMGGAAVAHMPLNQQAALALQIARSREGYGAWTTYKTGAYKGHLGVGGASTAPTSPGTTINTPSPDWGLAFASLGQSQDGKPSTLDQAKSLFPSTQETGAPPAADLQSQQMAGIGNVRQAQIATQAQALAAALQQKAATPLAWDTHPFGSAAGPRSPAPIQTVWGGQSIPMPGTTLTSTGNIYG